MRCSLFHLAPFTPHRSRVVALLLVAAVPLLPFATTSAGTQPCLPTVWFAMAAGADLPALRENHIRAFSGGYEVLLPEDDGMYRIRISRTLSAARMLAATIENPMNLGGLHARVEPGPY